MERKQQTEPKSGGNHFVCWSACRQKNTKVSVFWHGKQRFDKPSAASGNLTASQRESDKAQTQQDADFSPDTGGALQGSAADQQLAHRPDLFQVTSTSTTQEFYQKEILH